MTALGGGMIGSFSGFAQAMNGTWGPTPPGAAQGVSADEATRYAQQWLDQYQPGSTTEAPAAFPGYYTLDITEDGLITGMLSVNAYTVSLVPHVARRVRQLKPSIVRPLPSRSVAPAEGS